MKKLYLLLFLLTAIGFVNGFAQSRGVYVLKVDAWVWDGANNHSGSCTNRFDMFALFSDGERRHFAAQDLNPIGGTAQYYGHSTEFENNRSFYKLEIYGERNWKNWFNCKGNSGWKDMWFDPATYTRCEERSANDRIDHWSSNVTFRVYPKNIQLYPVGGVSELPSDSRISIAATYGFPMDIYKWEYIVPDLPGATWTRFPAALQTGENVSFSANELFGAAADQIIGHNVMIRVDYGCSFRAATSNIITLETKLSSPKIASVQPDNILCFGENNGSVKINFDRAIKPNELLNITLTQPAMPGWTDGEYNLTSLAPDNSFTWGKRLLPGTYTINLIGKYPNSSHSTSTNSPQHTATFTITAPTALTTQLLEADKRMVSCYSGNDGAVKVTAAGATPGYTLYYRSDPAAAWSTLAFSGNSVLLENLSAATYQLYVRDANGCTEKTAGGADKVYAVAITQPAAPLAFDGYNTSMPTAFGYTNGSITVLIKGGTANPDGSYNAIWQRANGTPITPFNSNAGTTWQTRVENLPAGDYTLLITDAKNCTINRSFTLTEPPLLTAVISLQNKISCKGDSDGKLLATAGGGVPGYRYEWYKVVGGVKTPIGQTTAAADLLPHNQYLVKVTDANNIERESAVFDLFEPALLTSSLAATAVKCNAGSDGAVTSAVAGGTLPYQYTWNNGATTPNIANVPEGFYTLQVEDAHGCNVRTSASVTQPAAPLAVADLQLTYPRAFGYSDGKIKVTLSGGTPAYNIVWKNAAGTVLSATELAEKIPAGEYFLTVTDANYSGTPGTACYLSASFTLTEPPPLTVNITETHFVSCKGFADGELTAHAAGGVPISGGAPYRYEWYRMNGATPTLIPANTAVASGLIAGTYKVKVTDWNNISKESTLHLLAEPNLLETQLAVRNVTCFEGNDGHIKTTTTGGTLPYQYVWSNGDLTPDVVTQPAGTYTLQLKDARGCTLQPSATIQQPAAALVITQVETKNPTAYTYTDGSVAVQLAGGTTPYSIQWKNSAGTVIATNTTTLANVGDGTYTLEVKDAQFAQNTNGSTRGCTITGTYTLTEPPLLKAVIAVQQVISCNKMDDGELVAHATGGIPAGSGLPYKYTWWKQVNGTFVQISQTDSILRKMHAGVYLVKVTDENNITRESVPFTLTEPDKLNISFTTTAVTCASGQDGSATATVAGGTLPYQYEWTTGHTGPVLTNIFEGTYMLFVKDGHGCETQKQVDIFIPGGITIQPTVTAPTCTGYDDGSIQLAVSGGIAPYTYQWSNGATTRDLQQLSAGSYTVTITDANRCIRRQTFILKDPAPLAISLGPDKTLCNGQQWTLNAAIPDEQARYRWSSDAGFTSAQAAVTIQQAGLYKVQVTDGKGCMGEGQIRISQQQSDISAEFLVATQVLKGEVVSLINISSPMPETVVWDIPAGRNITVISQNKMLAELRFDEAGVFPLGLKSGTGNCEQVFRKSITVLNKERLPQPGGAQTPFIKGFEVTPNPNGGQFTVKITLDKPADIRLRLINIISNSVVNDRKEGGTDRYQLAYNASLVPGTYVLLLETPVGHSIRKIVVY